MKRTPVESSDVVSIGYNPKDRQLEIEFREGRIYLYSEVPQDIYDAFLRADSFGGYFNAYINGYYRYRKVEETTAVEKPASLAFVTGNSRKMRDLKQALDQFGIEAEQLQIQIDEIQSNDGQKVAMAKAKAAFRAAGRPVLINDSYWSIPALRGFPGAYMSSVVKWLAAEDFLKLMEGKADRSICCTETLVYFDGKRSKVFGKDFWGNLTHEPRGETHHSIDKIIVFNGQDKTVAEWEQEASASLIPLEEGIWLEFAKWYNMQRKLRRV
jgi:non-canonical purine NTP pyrophosphatase (RdgB/HAM1 family)